MTQARSPRDGALYADVVGGVTTFFTMAYIVVVNPGILATPGTGQQRHNDRSQTGLVAGAGDPRIAGPRQWRKRRQPERSADVERLGRHQLRRQIRRDEPAAPRGDVAIDPQAV